MRRDARFDVAVVGAGPAGALCALLLARGGRAVALVDRRAPPRYKACGGGLTLRARGELEAWISLEGVIEHECRTAEVRLARTGLSFEVAREKPLVTMTLRADLDARIVEAARESGAELIAPCEVKGLERDKGRVRLRLESGTLEAGCVVAADGAVGPTAGAAGWPALPARVPALESEIAVGEPVLERFRGRARFDFDVPRDGYAWVFPKAGHLSIGCLATRRGGRTLRPTLEEYLARLELGPIASREDHGALIPVAPRRGPLARDGVFLVGDAAGLVEPLTCEGLGNALRSARLAAEAILGSCGAPAAAEARYQASLESVILPEWRSARWMARLCYRLPRLRDAAFRRRGAFLAEGVCRVIAGETSYGELLRRPASWIGLLRGREGRNR